MDKNKLDQIRKENEKLEYEFWKNFYETQKMLNNTLEDINNLKINKKEK